LMSERWVVGVDLAPSSDYTAIAAMRRTMAEGEQRPTFELLLLERVRGISYPKVVDRVRQLVERPELNPVARVRRPGLRAIRHEPSPPPLLAVDATGVGRAVIDMFVLARLNAVLAPVTFTAGHGARVEHVRGLRCHFVAKTEIVSGSIAALQEGRLRVAGGLELASTLRDELLKYKVRITPHGNETFGGEGAHDDLVTAVSIAIYIGDQSGSTIRHGHIPLPPGAQRPAQRPYGPHRGHGF
jgi:hypothetical protein